MRDLGGSGYSSENLAEAHQAFFWRAEGAEHAAIDGFGGKEEHAQVTKHNIPYCC